jgi:hypothetical protein
MKDREGKSDEEIEKKKNYDTGLSGVNWNGRNLRNHIHMMNHLQIQNVGNHASVYVHVYKNAHSKVK